jgi:carboxylate-amine ligase
MSHMGAELTLGAEEELHVVDLSRWQLSTAAARLLSQLEGDSFSSEMQRSTVETRTAVTTSLAGLREELTRLRQGLREVAEPAGLAVAAVGTAPYSSSDDFELTSNARYRHMREQYRMLVDEQLICGLQIHVGISDRDLAVQVSQRVSWILPILLALSASSPFWNGKDTGYASIRSLIWQRWPSAGPTGPLSSAAEYDALLEDLIASGVLADPGMAYFDVRPSSHVPTLELRVCDACPIVDDAVLIAGLFRAAVREAEISIEKGQPHHRLALPLQRGAMWQAARRGLSGYLLDDGARPRPVSAEAVIRSAVGRLRAQLEELGDLDEVTALLDGTLARGNSADRQRAAFANRGRLEDSMALAVRETTGPAAGPPPAVEALRSYRARAGDEAVMAGAQPREPYLGIVTHLRSLGDDELTRRVEQGRRWAHEHGLAFVVDGRAQDFDVDLVPRIVNEHEWTRLTTGLAQRARALEAFLQDVYGDGRVLAQGVVPGELVLDSPGWRDEARDLPVGTLRAPVQGFDLVRNEFGDWRVLEDNVRSPSGLAYATAVRELLDDTMPDLPRPARLLDPTATLAIFRRSVLGGSALDRVGAVLTSGPGSGAWFEHRWLAERADLLLVEPDDLDVRGGQVLEARSGRRIDALYLRMDGQLVDQVGRDGRRIGLQVHQVACEGGVFLANAPGNGVADDKAVYCYVPDLIELYLGERPLLESVPTYRTGDEEERAAVLERVGELVTKPVDGEGGRGVLIGPDATAREVAERREQIIRQPERWIAQEVVTLSWHPSLAGNQLEPRHVDLRAFVYAVASGDGGPADYAVAPAALTRVAAGDSKIVNSSRGGGAKDTWIIGAVEADPGKEPARVRTGG